MIDDSTIEAAVRAYLDHDSEGADIWGRCGAAMRKAIEAYEAAKAPAASHSLDQLLEGMTPGNTHPETPISMPPNDQPDEKSVHIITSAGCSICHSDAMHCSFWKEYRQLDDCENAYKKWIQENIDNVAAGTLGAWQAAWMTRSPRQESSQPVNRPKLQEQIANALLVKFGTNFGYCFEVADLVLHSLYPYLYGHTEREAVDDNELIRAICDAYNAGLFKDDGAAVASFRERYDIRRRS